MSSKVLPRLPVRQHIGHGVGRIADQQHIATGCPGGFRTLHHVTGKSGTFHRQVVAEDDTVEPEFIAQLFQPDRREAGGTRIYLRVDDVGRHYAVELETTVGNQVGLHPVSYTHLP